MPLMGRQVFLTKFVRQLPNRENTIGKFFLWLCKYLFQSHPDGPDQVLIQRNQPAWPPLLASFGCSGSTVEHELTCLMAPVFEKKTNGQKLNQSHFILAKATNDRTQYL